MTILLFHKRCFPLLLRQVMARSMTGVAPAYRVLFLYIEPFFALVGAYYALLQQQTYLRLSHPPTAPKYGIPTSTRLVLNQLANLYLFFALNEAFVLRATTDLKVWRTVLLALLIADVGHLYSVHPLGLTKYWDVRNWNAIDWGNLGFVYLGAFARVCFLLSPTNIISARLKRFGKREPNTPRRSTRRTKPTPKVKG